MNKSDWSTLEATENRYTKSLDDAISSYFSCLNSEK